MVKAEVQGATRGGTDGLLQGILLLLVRVNPKTMPMFPACFLNNGGRLAVAVASGATTVPGGRNVLALYLRATSNSSPAGAFGIHGGLARVKLPCYAAGVSNSMGGRLAAVVAAGTTSPGESDDGLPSEDCQAAVSAFRLHMELFRMSLRPVALMGSPTDELIQETLGTAKDCSAILEFLLTEVPVHRDTLKELMTVGENFLIVESQANECYVKADALANVIQGLKLVGNTFFEGVNLPAYSAPVVPLSTADVDKDSFFKELINVFIVLHTALYWEARRKYRFGMGGAN